MATTTKKSPKAKSKTTKRTVTKAAKTSAAKTTKKAVATKAAVVKPVKAAKTKRTFVQQLATLNLASGVLSLALAALAGFLMNHASYQLFTGLLTRDALASKANTVFVPAIHAVYDIELRWAVVAILVLSAIIPLMAATRSRKMYEDSLAKKVMLPRWIEMGIISGLMLEVAALLSGVQDIMTLKLIGGLVVVTCLLGWLSEKHNAAVPGTGRSTHLLSVFTGVLPWLLIATYAVGTWVYGMVRSPWFVYALYVALAVVFVGYCLNGRRQLKGTQDYGTTERNYLQISIFAKAAFAVILIVGLYKK